MSYKYEGIAIGGPVAGTGLSRKGPVTEVYEPQVPHLEDYDLDRIDPGTAALRRANKDHNACAELPAPAIYRYIVIFLPSGEKGFWVSDDIIKAAGESNSSIVSIVWDELTKGYAEARTAQRRVPA